MSEHTKLTLEVPDQRKFVEAFLQPGSPTGHLLVAPPGTGKTHTACAVVEQLATSGQATHVLVLAPSSLRLLWAAELSAANTGLPIVSVDRQTFRELQAAVPVGQAPWGAACVVVISLDLAKYSDVALAILAQRWDLVIIDECHWLSTMRRHELHSLVLGGLSKRLLLMTATPHDEPALLARLKLTQWSLTKPKLPVTDLVYRPDENEQRFVDALTQFLNSELIDDSIHTTCTVVRCLAESSIFSVEPVLLQWVAELSGKSDEERAPVTQNGEDEFPDDSRAPASLWRDPAAAEIGLQRLIAMLDSVQNDAKMQALRKCIADHRVSNLERPAICIVTRYARTALYLQSALADVGVTVGRATGDMFGEERLKAIDDFRSQCGALVVTYRALQGIEIPEAKLIVAYDTLEPLLLERIIGRFDRIGRRDPLTVIAMRRLC